jgi:ketosteroid isomerase-like protein
MVDTERAFARMSEEKGTRPAFMAFIAPDGILFRPKAVKGKQFMLDHPVPPAEKRDLLSWAPSFAEVSRAGDMGYTFGPWQYKSDIRGARPVAWGHFVTIWKKQADGSWKFAVDLGISHPEPPATALPMAASKKQTRPGKSFVSNELERAKLVAVERSFSNDSLSRGAQKAFLSHASPDVYVFREDKMPFTGRAQVPTAIPVGLFKWSWEPEGWDVSSSGDLGYSYGTYVLQSSPSQTETGNYFRIWKKQGGVWRVVVDVANPVPAKAG